MRKTAYPVKRTMNLFYKPDRTTKPTTIALYVIFVLVCLLGLSKVLVYDLWTETREVQRALALAEEERALVNRMEVLALSDENVGPKADMGTISISGSTV